MNASSPYHVLGSMSFDDLARANSGYGNPFSNRVARGFGAPLGNAVDEGPPWEQPEATTNATSTGRIVRLIRPPCQRSRPTFRTSTRPSRDAAATTSAARRPHAVPTGSG